MYTEFYDFLEKPFSLSPDPKFIFFSEKDVVRNSLVREIVRAYENETEKK